MGEKKKMALGAWMQKLAEAARDKKAIVFETKDGGRRSGRLTGLVMQEMKINNQRCELITQFQLNNDHTDTVPFFNVSKLDIFDD